MQKSCFIIHIFLKKLGVEYIMCKEKQVLTFNVTVTLEASDGNPLL